MIGPAIYLEAERTALGQWQIRSHVGGLISGWTPVRLPEDIAALTAMKAYAPDDPPNVLSDGDYRLLRMTWPTPEAIEGTRA